MSNSPDNPPETYGVYLLNILWTARQQFESSCVVFTGPDTRRYPAIECFNGDTTNLAGQYYSAGLRWSAVCFRQLLSETKCNLKEIL